MDMRMRLDKNIYILILFLLTKLLTNLSLVSNMFSILFNLSLVSSLFLLISKMSNLLLLTEVSVFKVEWSRIIPISNPELVCLEVHDHILLVAPGVVWHAGAAAAGPPGVAPGGAIHPPPPATALVAANPTILSRETADQVNLVCKELSNYQTKAIERLI